MNCLWLRSRKSTKCKNFHSSKYNRYQCKETRRLKICVIDNDDSVVQGPLQSSDVLEKHPNLRKEIAILL